MIWARMLAYVTGMVNQELRLRNEYLVARHIRQQAAESNIHCGISRSRPPGFSSTPHRHTARPFLVRASWTTTVRACQGCQG